MVTCKAVKEFSDKKPDLSVAELRSEMQASDVEGSAASLTSFRRALKLSKVPYKTIMGASLSDLMMTWGLPG